MLWRWRPAASPSEVPVRPPKRLARRPGCGCRAKARNTLKRCGWICIVAFLLSTLAVAAPKSAPKGAKISNDECLACHSNATLTKDENGKLVSLHVDDAAFKGGIHGMFGCTYCHIDIKGSPHQPTPAKPVCTTCHAKQRSQVEGGTQQYPSDLRRLPREADGDGRQRCKFCSLHFVRAERARQGGGGRLGQGRGVHRLPRHP